jgi:hypothetical protein
MRYSLEITNVISKYSKSFSYQKIYFILNGTKMCYKKHNDYFLKKKTKKWFVEKKTYRGDIDREYSVYVEIKKTDELIIIFDKEYKEYKFRLRKDKISRLIGESKDN